MCKDRTLHMAYKIARGIVIMVNNAQSEPCVISVQSNFRYRNPKSTYCLDFSAYTLHGHIALYKDDNIISDILSYW